MSEVVYVNYLKELNSKLIANSYNLNLDFELGSSHIMEQLSVLEQYLMLNNMEIQDKKGIPNLLGFDEITEQTWWSEYIKHKVNELRKIKQKNALFSGGPKHYVNIIPFEPLDIEDIEFIDEETTNEIEETVDTEENIESEDIDLFADTEEETTEEPTVSSFSFNDTDEDENEDDEPLLSDIFDNLQKAQNLFDNDEDLDEFQDEYALIDDEEPTEEQTESAELDGLFEDTEDSTGFTEDTDFTENTENTDFGFDDNSFGDSGTDGFSFEQPQVEQQKERVVTDAMGDKATDVINKGLNALLKKIAK